MIGCGGDDCIQFQATLNDVQNKQAIFRWLWFAFECAPDFQIFRGNDDCFIDLNPQASVLDHYTNLAREKVQRIFTNLFKPLYESIYPESCPDSGKIPANVNWDYEKDLWCVSSQSPTHSAVKRKRRSEPIEEFTESTPEFERS
eukprot:GHVP01062425.1.p1 GENE.GHVP01062425.1~~GHVP01062425.1.p1  ORF type:complete len:144 (+),score=19.06 GHVP01062425.1:531-962(+)